jgi:aspartyl protease family protein
MDFNSLSGGDWQNFSYLALLLVVMLSGLFSRRDLAFGKILKYLGIWSVIALFIVTLYSYRYEFVDFKSRILGELNPSATQVTKSGNLVINISQDGHFYMDVAVNGIMMRFMIDTGASDITISLGDAKKLGIDLTELQFNKPYQTANGKSWGANIKLREVAVGNAKFYNISASVNSSEMGVSLLGMSFLRQFKKYEFYQDKLILTL